MKKTNYQQGCFSSLGFTLIEVVIASAILSITVFGVYKLIGENSKLINNSDNYLQLNNLFLNLGECINSKGYSTYSSNASGSIKKYNFGLTGTGCEIGNSNHVLIDNINYNLESKLTGTGTNYIDFELKIEGDGVGVEKKEFRLYK